MREQIVQADAALLQAQIHTTAGRYAEATQAAERALALLTPTQLPASPRLAAVRRLIATG
jgi:hypothetical protein